MKKLNNKGLTLIELIVSIALISMALLFLFRILVMLRYDENYEALNSKMLVNKSQIVKNIQTDFIEKKLIRVTCLEGQSVSNGWIGTKVRFRFLDTSEKTLTLSQRNLLYGITNQEEGRALDDNLVYGGLEIKKNTIGNNSYIMFNISVNYSRTGKTAEENRIRFTYLYKNNEVTFTNCGI